MNVLALVQEFCRRQGLPVPTGLQSSTDAQVRQIGGLLNECAEDLITRKMYRASVLEKFILGTGVELLHTFTLGEVLGIVPDSMFDRTANQRITGSVPADRWQAMKSNGVTGPWPQFRLLNNKLYTLPAIPTGNQVYFEYYSPYLFQDNLGLFTRAFWAADTDVMRVHDAIPLAYLRWKWKAEKGLEYAEDFRAYEHLIDTIAFQQGSFRTVDASCSQPKAAPGIFVPEGSWPLP